MLFIHHFKICIHLIVKFFFSSKILNAESAGYNAAIVHNFQNHDSLVHMGAGAGKYFLIYHSKLKIFRNVAFYLHWYTQYKT